MQIRGQFSDFFLSTMLPALNAKIREAYKAKKAVAPRVLNVTGTTRSIEQYAIVSGVGLPTLVGEGEDTPTDNFVQGFSKTFTPAKYGLGIAATQELVEDDKFGIMSSRSVALSNAIYQSREIQAASIFNNGFSDTGPDGQSLFAASHPLIKSGGTQNNLLSVAADLDVTSLELAMTDWELTKTHEGYYQMYGSPKVLVASNNRWNVTEILKSQMRSDTANHTINAFDEGTETGDVIDYIVWAFLTDPDAWFLVAPPTETELIWLDRKAPYTKSDFVEKNETGYVYMRYRADFGYYGWKGVYGTPGA